MRTYKLKIKNVPRILLYGRFLIGFSKINFNLCGTKVEISIPSSCSMYCSMYYHIWNTHAQYSVPRTILISTLCLKNYKKKALKISYIGDVLRFLEKWRINRIMQRILSNAYEFIYDVYSSRIRTKANTQINCYGYNNCIM